eukprot:scaffold377379_cov39-Prasinocladus_malaysianus.AAC.1
MYWRTGLLQPRHNPAALRRQERREQLQSPAEQIAHLYKGEATGLHEYFNKDGRENLPAIVR